MDITLPIVKVNGKSARGQAHIQPGVNNWIGVCVVRNHLLPQHNLKDKGFTVEFEGPFNSGEECINGKGKAKVLHVSPSKQKNRVIITIEGVGEPLLEKKLKKELRFSYDENLPVYLNSYKKRPEL
ncbi:hypothetical protein [Fodinibius sp.]|uniref:hypothetical protein n=1 Tax=Fodinibius sp. TaxID=1872440 RepID=UPI0035628D70